MISICESFKLEDLIILNDFAFLNFSVISGDYFPAISVLPIRRSFVVLLGNIIRIEIDEGVPLIDHRYPFCPSPHYIHYFKCVLIKIEMGVHSITLSIHELSI